MRHVILSGLPGTGKSTLGRALAAALGRTFVDTDELLAARSGQNVAALFRDKGELAFRDLEAAVVREALALPTPHVIALGGGAVTTTRLRHELLERGFVCTLHASLPTLVARLAAHAASGGAVRPIVASDPGAHLARLADTRRAAYAEHHLQLDTESLVVGDAVRLVTAALAEDTNVVPLGERSYLVRIVDGEPAALEACVARLAPTRVVTVTDVNVQNARNAWIHAALGEAPRVVLPPGEHEKTIDAVKSIWDGALTHGADRGACLVAVGGGVVGDLTGFAASTLLRGVRVVQVPTTLLAMVDASVGGKTGFDHARGKNLIGAFHQPSAVLCDLAHLTTLAPAHYVAGLAEIVKVGLVLDAALFADLEQNVAAIAAHDPAVLRRLVRAAIAAKIAVVRDDEHEMGVRALLNAGHTVGHAIETAGAYMKHLHGEAVALGMVAELESMRALGLCANVPLERTRALLQALRLPVDWRAAQGDVGEWRVHLGADKKRRGRGLAFPVIDDVGRARVERVPMDDFAASLRT